MNVWIRKSACGRQSTDGSFGEGQADESVAGALAFSYLEIKRAVELAYPNKEKAESILSRPVEISFDKPWDEDKSKLILGDNMDVLLYMLRGGLNKKIDLIYIDPPFATNNTFTFDGSRANTMSSKKGGDVAYTDTLGGEAYLEFLRKRLILAREALSDAGSIYLHIDCKVGHHVKLIMDEVFGAENFRNDITRVKCNDSELRCMG